MKFRRFQLVRLREEIKRLADEGRGFSARIQASRGLDRHYLRLEKADVGRAARVCLLAYGLLRGVPYRAMEARTRERVTVYLADAVANAASANFPEGGSLQNEAVLDWLSVADPSQQPAEAAQ